jgi:hypothetical protein
MAIRGKCPNCNSPLTGDELRVDPLVCPACKARLQVLIKAEWTYTVLSFAVALVIGCFQRYESIVFGFWVLIYAAIILLIIKIYRWELHLPIKIAEVPNYQLQSTDAP